MLIQWQGPHMVRRVLLGYTWGPENDWTCEVAEADAAAVLRVDPLMEMLGESEDAVEASGEAPAEVSFEVGMVRGFPDYGFEVQQTEEEEQ